MSVSESSHTTPTSASSPTLRDRLLAPLLTQLKKGATPPGLSRSVAIALPLSIFPFLGVTSFLCWIGGTVANLNHIAMQVTNQFMTVVHLAMMPVYIRLGEIIFGLPRHTLNPQLIIESVKTHPELFLSHYQEAFLGAFGAWFITAPILSLVTYPILLVIFRKVAQKTSREPGTHV